MDEDANESGWDAGERWLWDHELANDPAYETWLESLAAQAANEQEYEDADYCER